MSKYVDIRMPAPTEYEKEVCGHCRFGYGCMTSNKLCQYILIHQEEHPEAVSHRRPCKYNECIKCGVWEPTKWTAARKKYKEKLIEKYKDGTIK